MGNQGRARSRNRSCGQAALCGGRRHYGSVSRQHPIRFAFRISSGPNAGLSVGQFRVWCHKDDTYIADAGVPSWKTSLHGEVAWQTAETKESFTSPEARLSGTSDRAPWKFAPPEFEDGQRLAFVVCATRGALGTSVAPQRYRTVEVNDRWDELTKVNIWMTLPKVELPDASLLLGPVLTLESGANVWAAVGREYIAPSDPEPVPGSSIIEPQVPGRHDVTAPGLLIRGLHLANRPAFS